MRAFNWHSFDTPNFRQRVLSSLLIAPLALLAVYLGGWIFALVVVLLAALGLNEWLRLIDSGMDRRARMTAFAALGFVLLATLVAPSAALFALGLATASLYYALRRFGVGDKWAALGLPYMAGSGLALFYLRAMDTGLVYYLLVAVWGTDIGAYVAGRLIGGPKLAPAVSPNKTWAGLFGGMALAALFGYVAAACLDAQRAAFAALLAVGLAAVAQAGDLFESFFKRRSGVKESGALIPGHGGVLDRIDGLVFAAILLALFQVLYGAEAQWW